MLVDEEETRRIERRFVWLVDSSLGLLDDNDRSDCLDSVDDNRVDDDEKEEVVDEALDEDEDDDDSSITIDLKKEVQSSGIELTKKTNGARRQRFSEFADELFFPSKRAKRKNKTR